MNKATQISIHWCIFNEKNRIILYTCNHQIKTKHQSGWHTKYKLKSAFVSIDFDFSVFLLLLIFGCGSHIYMLNLITWISMILLYHWWFNLHWLNTKKIYFLSFYAARYIVLSNTRWFNERNVEISSVSVMFTPLRILIFLSTMMTIHFNALARKTIIFLTAEQHEEEAEKTSFMWFSNSTERLSKVLHKIVYNVHITEISTRKSKL